MAGDPSVAPFPTTRWSRIVGAGDLAAPESRAALAELCAAYWYPLYALIRRDHPADEARELAQDYCARLLEKGTRAAADRDRSRFRALLKTDCGFFLTDCRDRQEALKRAGGRATISFDALDAEARYRAGRRDDARAALRPRLGLDPAGGRPRHARRRVRRGGPRRLDRVASRRADRRPRGAAYAEIAAQLGTTEAAIQQAVRRLRKRYREALRARIAATLDASDEAAIQDEVRDLFAALGD